MWVLQHIGVKASTAHKLMALTSDTRARSAPGSFHVFEEVLSQTKCGQTAARQDDYYYFFFLPDSSLNLSSLDSLWLTLFEKLILAAKNLWRGAGALPFWSHVCSLELKNRRREEEEEEEEHATVAKCTDRQFFQQWRCGWIVKLKVGET